MGQKSFYYWVTVEKSWTLCSNPYFSYFPLIKVQRPSVPRTHDLSRSETLYCCTVGRRPSEPGNVRLVTGRQGLWVPLLTRGLVGYQPSWSWFSVSVTRPRGEGFDRNEQRSSIKSSTERPSEGVLGRTSGQCFGPVVGSSTSFVCVSSVKCLRSDVRGRRGVSPFGTRLKCLGCYEW